MLTILCAAHLAYGGMPLFAQGLEREGGFILVQVVRSGIFLGVVVEETGPGALLVEMAHQGNGLVLRKLNPTIRLPLEAQAGRSPKHRAWVHLVGNEVTQAPVHDTRVARLRAQLFHWLNHMRMGADNGIGACIHELLSIRWHRPGFPQPAHV